jgi:hypothetical protein
MIIAAIASALKGFLTVGLFIAAAAFFIASDVISGVLLSIIAVISLKAW